MESSIRSWILLLVGLFVLSSSLQGVLSASRVETYTYYAYTPPPAAPSDTWCVAKPGVPDISLQGALDWVCGPGQADCARLQIGQSCFFPDNIRHHASYAFNNYYLKSNKVEGSCDFAGAATITYKDPSFNSTCVYPSKRY